MIELGVIEDGEDGAAGSGFGVGGGVDEAGDAGVEDGSGAHGAGFECGVESAVFEPVVFERQAGFAEGYDLSVGGGVAVAEDTVLATADDFVFVDDDCAYGDFAVGFGGLSFGDCGAEVVEISHACCRTCGVASGPKNRAICSARLCNAGRLLASASSS